MLNVHVADMTCGHCASTITRAVKAVDREAQVEVDLNAKTVRIESGSADATELLDAIREAGYHPAAMDAAPAAAPARSCCGGCA